MDNMRGTYVFIGNDVERLKGLLDQLTEMTSVKFVVDKEYMIVELEELPEDHHVFMCDRDGEFCLSQIHSINELNEVTPEEFIRLAREFYPKKDPIIPGHIYQGIAVDDYEFYSGILFGIQDSELALRTPEDYYYTYDELTELKDITSEEQLQLLDEEGD